MALISPKVIAQVSCRSNSALAAMSWEWVLRADGQVLYRLTGVDGRAGTQSVDPGHAAEPGPAAIVPERTGTRPRPCWTISPASMGTRLAEHKAG